MQPPLRELEPQRVLVVLPTWLGDCVMATPLLRAIRHRYPQARITGLIQQSVKDVLRHTPWLDRLIRVPARGNRRRRGLVHRLRAADFDLAILLPNSFRTALLVWRAGIPRRLGYQRDGRGFLLTDRLHPLRDGWRFRPDPTLGYYMRLADALGASTDDRTMTLFIHPHEQQQVDDLLAGCGVTSDGSRPLVLLNPGANKPQKCWNPRRFARVADWCVQHLDAHVAVSGAPRECDIVKAVIAEAEKPLINLLDFPMNLRLLKALTRRCDLMITNDTGPRHIAAAMNVPVITLFGPTPASWTQLGIGHEVQVSAPLGHIDEITVEQVKQAVAEQMQRPATPDTPPATITANP